MTGTIKTKRGHERTLIDGCNKYLEVVESHDR